MKKINHKPYLFLLPEGVANTLEQFCRSNSIFKNPEVGYYKYVYIVHTITTHYCNYAKGSILYEGCPLHSKTLASIIGVRCNYASDFLRNLISLGIIKRKGTYQVGKKSFKYMLSDIPAKFEEVLVPSQYNHITSKIINKHKKRNEKDSDLCLYESYLNEISMEIPQTLSENSSCSMKYNEIYINCNDKTISYPIIHMILPFKGYSATQTISDPKVDHIEYSYGSAHKTNHIIYSIKAIQNGDWYVCRPDTESRVYSNLTNLKRELRPYLRYRGMPLVELDIRNSQPLIASILIMEYWQKQCDVLPWDVTLYKADCETGIFYDYFMQLNGVKTEERGDFKAKFFADVFFSKVNSKYVTNLKRQFIGRYPNVYEAICHIKGGEGSDQYNMFAISLQRKEASIIFENVNLKLLKEVVPCFNIFDSILCLSEHSKLVEGRLKDAFNEIRLRPTINKKD